MQIETMLYRRYKTSFADCETVAGSYNKVQKTIQVILPDGRLKPSGVRGQRYIYRWFDGTAEDGRTVRVCIKAVSTENAVKRLLKDYPSCSWDID